MCVLREIERKREAHRAKAEMRETERWREGRSECRNTTVLGNASQGWL